MTLAQAKERGLKRYFTGVACPYGHLSYRQTSNSSCLECALPKTLLWQQKNTEKRRVINNRYRNKNREKVRAARRKYEATIKPKIKEKNARHRQKYPERVKAAQKSWALRNREKVREAKRRSYYRNQEKYRVYRQNRKARVRGAEGKHSKADIDKIFLAQRKKCAYCRVLLTKKKRHVDHIKAVSKGGSNYPKNIQILCVTCNLEKHAKDALDFARLKGKLL